MPDATDRQTEIKELKNAAREAANTMLKLRDQEQMSAEDEQMFERAHEDMTACEKRIQVLEAAVDAERFLSAPQGHPELLRGQDVPAPRRGNTDDGDGPANYSPHGRRYNRGLAAWMRRNYPVPREDDWERDARACGIDLAKDQIDVRLLADPKREVRAWEQRADLDTATATEGTEWIPQGFVMALEESMLAIGGLRNVATILRTNTGNALPYPTNNDTGNSAVLVTEAADASATADPTTGSVTFNAYKYSSKFVKVSAELIQDSAFPIPALLGRMLGERLARGINTACTTGTGSSQPNGIVTAVDAAGSGVTAASATALTADEIIDLEHTVDPSYRSAAYRCGFMLHDGVLKEIRKLKDGNSQYLWMPGLQFGVPSTLLSWPYTINQAMASSLASTNKVLLFGAMSKYIIREVAGVRLHRLVELYRGNDQEAFVAFMRIDGDLLDAGTNPIELLTMAA